ncbi:MAG TPA: hypothetical protein VFZ58_05965 [Candidatus Saccharimonadales bacterium]
MQIPAFDLATRIAEESSNQLSWNETTIAQLASVLLRPHGVVRQGRHYIVVLKAPLTAAAATPICVIGALGKQPRRREAISDSLVASFFRRRAQDLGNKRPKGYRSHWAPVANSSTALMPIGGDLQQQVGKTEGERRESNIVYRWYNLREVPLGGIVFRLDTKRSLYVFQRLSKEHWWRVTLMQDAWHEVDIAGTLAKMSGEEPVSGLSHDSRCIKPQLIQQPPG